MANSEVSREQAQRRSFAVRALLANPLLNGTRDSHAFSIVAAERAWLVKWFESTAGWPLYVDVRGGWARLSKRSRNPDVTRPARRVRGAGHPFDRRRYQLLCLVCAELVARPLTTIGILASAVTSASAADDQIATFNSARAQERSALVDALKLLERWGVLWFTGGEVEAYATSESGNALLEVDGSRLHRLLACARAPSTMDGAVARDDSTVLSPAQELGREPRYGDAPLSTDDDVARTRWLRHSIARRLLDDPVIYIRDLSPAERDYLAHPSGRRWLRERAEEAGFVVEERAEGMLAIDLDHVATDQRFPAPNDNAKQAALLLIEHFVPMENGERHLVSLTVDDVNARAADLLHAHASWAKQYRSAGGAAELAAAAVDVLVQFDLARREDTWIHPMPAIARYRAANSNGSSSPGAARARRAQRPKKGRSDDC